MNGHINGIGYMKGLMESVFATEQDGLNSSPAS